MELSIYDRAVSPRCATFVVAVPVAVRIIRYFLAKQQRSKRVYRQSLILRHVDILHFHFPIMDDDFNCYEY